MGRVILNKTGTVNFVTIFFGLHNNSYYLCINKRESEMSYKVKIYDEDKIYVRDIPSYYRDIKNLNLLCCDVETLEEKLDEDSMFNLTYDWLVNRLLDLYIEEFGGEWENLNVIFVENDKEDNEEEILSIGIEHI
jgi:hypothetical protein